MTASPRRRPAAVRAALRKAAAGTGAYPDEQRLVPSAGQERLWFLDQLSPGSPAYNVPLAFRLSGPLDVGALSQALAAVVTRHDSLRSNIVAADGTPVLTITPDHRVIIAVDDIGSDAAGEQAWLGRHIRAPFDLGRDPLVRARLARFGADHHLLLVVIHHAVCDGWSQDVLVRELSTAYDQLVRNGQTNLPPVPAQYPDFAAWQRERLAERSAAELAHWREHLAGAPVQVLEPRLSPSIQHEPRATHYEEVELVLRHSTSERLRALARSLKLPLNVLTHAVWAAAFAERDARGCVLIGTVTSGRPPGLRGVEEMVGLFTNVLPLRVDLPLDSDLRACMARLGTALLGMRAHEHSDLEAIARWSGRSARELQQILHSRSLVFLNTPDFAAGENAPFELSLRSARAHLGVALRAYVTPGAELRWKLSFDGRTISERSARALLARIRNLSEALPQARGTVRDWLFPRPTLNDGPQE